MRKNFLLMFAVTLCTMTAFSQKKDKDRIQGSGNVITQDFTVKSFDALNASGVYSLHLSQGDKESLKIEADDNLMDLFIVENEGSKLKIAMKKNSNFNAKKTLKVYVTFKNLKTLDLSMVGATSSDEKLQLTDLTLKNQSVGSVNLDMALKSLHLENESVGNVKLTGKADNAVIKNNSVGSVQAGDFVVQTMDIDNSGVGSAEVNAEKELKVSDSFLGKVRNKGNATIRKKNKVVI